VRANLDTARQARALAPDGPLAQTHGTRYPILQGPMTRVSDTAAFARAVADNGALPFLALALMRGPEVHQLLSETRRQMGERPWGVGVLGFVPAELRKVQLAQVCQVRPSHAIIAGGRPSQARQLEEHGISTYLHVPSPGLLESFIRDGARKFIFEGRECGGHVGPRSSFALWQSALDVLRAAEMAHPEQFHIVFAGRIAREFDFHGPNFTVDAACAASLAALFTAVEHLRSGTADFMLVGAADGTNNPLRHFTQPVLFEKQVRQMHADGVRVFLEVGPGTVLTTLVTRILNDTPVTVLALDAPGRPSWTQLGHVLARLSVLGLPVRLAAWFEGRDLPALTLTEFLTRERTANTPKPTDWILSPNKAEPVAPLPERKPAQYPAPPPVPLENGHAQKTLRSTLKRERTSTAMTTTNHDRAVNGHAPLMVRPSNDLFGQFQATMRTVFESQQAVLERYLSAQERILCSTGISASQPTWSMPLVRPRCWRSSKRCGGCATVSATSPSPEVCSSPSRSASYTFLRDSARSLPPASFRSSCRRPGARRGRRRRGPHPSPSWTCASNAWRTFSTTTASAPPSPKSAVP